MGLQVIIKAESIASIESRLGSLGQQCEVFPIESGIFGFSIPTKVIDTIGDSALEKQLALFEYYDLWSGEWKKPKSKWKLW